MTDGNVQLASPPNPRIFAVANNSAVDHRVANGTGGVSHNSTLAGVAFILQSFLFSEAYYESSGKAPPIMMQSPGEVNDLVHIKPDEACAVFTDPTERTIQDMQGFAFRMGAFLANHYPSAELESAMDANLTTKQSVIGYVEGTHNVFRTSYVFFFAAVAVEVSCIAIILTTYWRWWELGRPVSFSSIEIAKVQDQRTTVQADTDLTHVSTGLRSTFACRLQLELLRKRYRQDGR